MLSLLVTMTLKEIETEQIFGQYFMRVTRDCDAKINCLSLEML